MPVKADLQWMLVKELQAAVEPFLYGKSPTTFGSRLLQYIRYMETYCSEGDRTKATVQNGLTC
jgi:hypothetical protein